VKPSRYADPIWRGTAAVCGAVLVLFVAGPVVRLLFAASPATLGEALRDPEVMAAIQLTVLTALTATLLAVGLGTPLAYALARGKVPGGRVVQALLELPTVIPHPVAGIALLLFLGRKSPVGGAAAAVGLEFVSQVPGIIAAMLFVAVPILLSGAREAFAAVDPRLERAARSLGDAPSTVFRRVTLPLAGRGVLAAAVLAWARAVSEFGSIVILTYHPRVASILIYDRFTASGLPSAIPVAVLLLLVALLVFGAARALSGKEAA